MKYRLKKGDKVLISLEEHASNVLPWFKLKEDIGIEIDYYKDLDSIDSDVKVISLAGITNVLGNVRELERIGNYCKKNNIDKNKNYQYYKDKGYYNYRNAMQKYGNQIRNKFSSNNKNKFEIKYNDYIKKDIKGGKEGYAAKMRKINNNK